MRSPPVRLRASRAIARRSPAVPGERVSSTCSRPSSTWPSAPSQWARVIMTIDCTPSSPSWSRRRSTIVPSPQGRVAAGASPAGAVASSTAVVTAVAGWSRPSRPLGEAGACPGSGAAVCGIPSVKRVSAVPTGMSLVTPRDAACRCAGAFCGELAQEPLPAGPDHARLVRAGLLERRRAEPPPQLRVLDQLEQPSGESLHVTARNQDPVAPGLDDVGRTTRAIEADDGQALAHRLDDYHPESLEAGAEREYRSLAERLVQVPRAPHEQDVPTEAALGDHALEAIPPAAAAVDPQLPVGVPARDPIECGDQQVEALLAVQTPGCDDRLCLELRRLTAEAGHGVRDPDNARGVAEELLVVVQVVAREHCQHVEGAVVAVHVGAQP